MFKRDQAWAETLSHAGAHCSAAAPRRFWNALVEATERHQQRGDTGGAAAAGWDPFEVWQQRIRKD